MKRITCRAHGGTFVIEPKRGRPPVKCSDDNPCSKLTGDRKVPVHPAEAAPKPRFKASRGVTKGKQAKAQLEGLGWQAEGRLSDGLVTVTATRGVELLVITWDDDGALLSQDYSLWDTSVGEGRNGRPKPEHKLPFDPYETPDRDLVRYLSGMKVTWWNSLAQAEETAIISPSTIKIEHSYNGEGTEAGEFEEDRMVKFVDHSGRGFRAFRVAALIKVG